jgi:uncharacterized protein YggT (Ycf19 family)
MTNPIVTKDDARQVKQHEAVKATVEGHVNAEIANEATAPSPDGKARVVEVATQLRETAIDETVAGERAVGRGRVAARGSQFVDYAFFVLYSLLAIRLVLALIAAQSGNGFVRFIGAVSGPFYAPFRGIIGSPTSEGGNTLAAPILVALAAYMILHAAINGLLRMVAQRKTEI